MTRSDCAICLDPTAAGKAEFKDWQNCSEFFCQTSAEVLTLFGGFHNTPLPLHKASTGA